jgi:hypothetical protein
MTGYRPGTSLRDCWSPRSTAMEPGFCVCLPVQRTPCWYACALVTFWWQMAETFFCELAEASRLQRGLA